MFSKFSVFVISVIMSFAAAQTANPRLCCANNIPFESSQFEEVLNIAGIFLSDPNIETSVECFPSPDDSTCPGGEFLTNCRSATIAPPLFGTACIEPIHLIPPEERPGRAYAPPQAQTRNIPPYAQAGETCSLMLAATTSLTRHPLLCPCPLPKLPIRAPKTAEILTGRSLSLLMPDGVGGGAGKPEEGEEGSKRSGERTAAREGGVWLDALECATRRVQKAKSGPRRAGSWAGRAEKVVGGDPDGAVLIGLRKPSPAVRSPIRKSHPEPTRAVPRDCPPCRVTAPRTRTPSPPSARPLPSAASGPPSHGRRRHAAPPDCVHSDRHEAAAPRYPHARTHTAATKPTAETRTKGEMTRSKGARARTEERGKNAESQGKQKTGAFCIVADAHTASTATESEYTGIPTPNAGTQPAHDAGRTHSPSSPSQRVYRLCDAPPPDRAAVPVPLLHVPAPADGRYENDGDKDRKGEETTKG
ncbi:hypothetical protein DFH09DRAFT_1338664 [Mycena vulgaris]|nr:hypothetical protein DFH09DRAFT_1338664 [Mycena vulgaris]